MMMKSCFWAEDAATALQDRLGLPRWLRPAGAGLLLGLIALQFPHVIGVGYEVTTLALTGQLALGAAVVFAVVKVVAVAITLGGRMGGGVFSPALVVGALTGLAFGLIATKIFPDQSGSETLYALAGMGAVAAAVLGAPISTTLIVFELTGDWQTGIAVMTAVSLASAVSSRLVAQSYFLTQLARRGVDLARGTQTWLLRARPVGQLMVPADAPGVPDAAVLRVMAQGGRSLTQASSLETALRVFERTGETVLPVIGTGRGTQELEGAVFQLDVLRAYAGALAARAAEEHG
jgi:CIC family chloride channel protein